MKATITVLPGDGIGYEIMDSTVAVLRELDHRNLNQDVPWLADVIPSTENLVVKIWERLADHIPSGRLARLVLWETPRNYAEYSGE